MAAREVNDQYADQLEAAPTFDDELNFNAWQLSPAFPEPYRTMINKDAVLGFYRDNVGDLQFIEQNLQMGVYLSKTHYKQHVGWFFVTDKNKGGLSIEEKNYRSALALVPREHKVLGVKKLYSETSVFNKTIHNSLSRAYTRMALTRGIKGRASRELRTKVSEREHTLRDETRRDGIFGGMFKKNRQQQGGY